MSARVDRSEIHWRSWDLLRFENERGEYEAHIKESREGYRHTPSAKCWCRPYRDHVNPRLWVHRSIAADESGPARCL